MKTLFLICLMLGGLATARAQLFSPESSGGALLGSLAPEANRGSYPYSPVSAANGLFGR